MKFFFAVLMIALSAESLFSQTDSSLIQIATNAYDDRRNAENKQDRVQVFRKHFEGLSDELKIKSLVLRLYDVDQNPKWNMSSEIIMGPQYAIADDPNFISDWSSLREMLEAEKNPRKFYLLSKIAPWTNANKQHDFVAERTHMLFADGRVAKDEGEYTRPYAHDVSEYAYTAIIGNLKALGADFEPPAKSLPHEEQAVILAKWLKENWPRCENIKIPSRLLGEKSRLRKSVTEKPKSSPLRNKEREQGTLQEAKPQNEESRLPWIIAGVLLVGILALLLKTFKGKSTS